MNRLFSNGKKWFLVISLFASLFLTSQVFATQNSLQTATATIATGALNVRSGPGLDYAVITTVNQGNVVTLLGRNANSSWAYIQTSASAKGWVNASSTYITPSVAISSLDVVTTATPTAVPSTPTPTPKPPTGATALVATGALNVRSGPGVTYSVITVASQGNTVSLLGRNANSSWAKIRLSKRHRGLGKHLLTYGKCCY